VQRRSPSIFVMMLRSAPCSPLLLDFAVRRRADHRGVASARERRWLLEVARRQRHHGRAQRVAQAACVQMGLIAFVSSSLCAASGADGARIRSRQSRRSVLGARSLSAMLASCLCACLVRCAVRLLYTGRKGWCGPVREYCSEYSRRVPHAYMFGE
jgi:hypothetical protein